MTFDLRNRALALLAFVGLVFSAHAATGNTQPNILLFMADDMTWHDCGAFGNKDVKTPNIDRLAAQGIKLNKCYAGAPMCSPLRQSLYTGLFPVRNGAYPNHGRVKDGVKSLPHFLKPLGYRVGILGKRHEAPLEAFPFEFLGGRHHDNGKGIDLEVEKAKEFINRDAAQPYCVVVTSNQPHEPWNRGDASAYDPKTLTPPPYLANTAELRKQLAKYYAEITYMDAQLGQCMRYVEASASSDNTLIVFLSEQGASLPFGKWTCYETGLRAAAIAAWPSKIKAGSSTDAIIQYVDFVPTFIEMAGGSPRDKDFDGRSALRVLTGETNTHHAAAFGIQTTRGIYHGTEAYAIRSVHDGRYVYIRNLNAEDQFMNMVTKRSPVFASWKRQAAKGNQFAADRVSAYQTRPAVELYDLKNDPWSMKNLAGDLSQKMRLKKMETLLQSWMKQQGDKGVATELAAKERQVKR